MGIYDAMMLCRADVQTYCFGLAASMGAFLLGAGKRGKRYSMPNSRIMIHQPLGGASGQAVDIEIQAKEIMYHKVSAWLACCSNTHTTWCISEAQHDGFLCFASLCQMMSYRAAVASPPEGRSKKHLSTAGCSTVATEAVESTRRIMHLFSSSKGGAYLGCSSCHLHYTHYHIQICTVSLCGNTLQQVKHVQNMHITHNTHPHGAAATPGGA